MFFDLETTGTDVRKHGIIQFAGIVEIDGEIVDELEIKINPGEVEWHEKAIEANGITPDMVKEHVPKIQAYSSIDKFLTTHVDKYDKKDKMIPAGYNVNFDRKFLEQFYYDNGNKYFGGLVNYYDADVFYVLKYLRQLGMYSGGLKLTEACEHFGIELTNAHDALADIKATRQLHYHIANTFIGIGRV